MRTKITALALALATLGACETSTNVASKQTATVVQAATDNTRTRLDRVRGRLWHLTLEGVAVREAGSERSVVLPLPGWIVAGAEDACAPDIALGPKGEVVVTSNVISTVWRVDPETLAVSVHALQLDSDRDKDVGLTHLVFSAPHGAFFAASEAHGTVWKINTALTRGEKVLGQSAPDSERTARCAIG
jgi:hypothetical protein